MGAGMSDSEDAQPAAVAGFLESSQLDEEMGGHDWTALARGYNGPQFAKNNYDNQLHDKYQKYAAGPTPDLDLRAAQLYLRFAGFDPGPVDGVMGDRTRKALIAFQTRQGLDATGEVDAALLDSLVTVALP